jgi:gamma-glutamyltranspeptidase/glutathione hydrolase/leukotriene-C4 hydrolase
MNNLTSKYYVDEVLRLIKDDQTFSQSYYGPGWPVKNDQGTAHISVVAPNGDAVSLTASVNRL